MLRLLIGITTTAFFGAMAMSAHADSTLNFTTGKGAEPNTVMVSQGKVRMESVTPQGKSVMIYDDSQKHFISFSDQQKNFMVMDQNSVKQQVRMMQEMKQKWQAKMQEQMKQMSPEQRQQMEQQMAKMGMGESQPNQPPTPKFTVNKTNRTENVNGVSCTVYESFRGSERIGDACIASPEALRLSKTDYKTLKGMFAFQRDMQKQFASASGRQSAQNDMGMFDKVEGLAVKVTDNRGGVMTLGGISHDGLATELFKIPAGYQKVDPMSQQQEGQAGSRGGAPAGQQGGYRGQQPGAGDGYRNPQGGSQNPPSGYR